MNVTPYRTFEPTEPGSQWCRGCGEAEVAHDLYAHCPHQPPECRHVGSGAVNAYARLSFDDPAELEEQVRALVEAATLARDFLAKLPIPMTRRAEADYRVADLHAALAHFKEARDADG